MKRYSSGVPICFRLNGSKYCKIPVAFIWVHFISRLASQAREIQHHCQPLVFMAPSQDASATKDLPPSPCNIPTKEVIFRKRVWEDPICFSCIAKWCVEFTCSSSVANPLSPFPKRDLALSGYVERKVFTESDGLRKCPRNNGHRPSSYADASKENTSQHVSKNPGWYEAICTKISINRSMKIKIY